MNVRIKVVLHVLIMLKRQGDQSSRKMQYPTEGPYTVLKINTNGTLRIRRGNYDEIIHVRRLKPFRRRIEIFSKKINQRKETVKTGSLRTRSGRENKRPERFQH